MTSRRCTATCLNGTPCRAWAVHGTDPPRCSAHRGASGAIEAPVGNEKALKHGGRAEVEVTEDCSIDVVIERLYQRQVQLDAYITERWESGVSVGELAHVLRLHGQNASRLGRLLRDRRALSGEAADGISGAVAQALDELSSELGTQL